MARFNAALHLALSGVLLASSIAVAGEAEMYRGYETPPYTVEASQGDVELRSYGPHLVAEVTVSGDRRGAINRGFQILAGYIFGGNERGEKVAMTVPVTQAPADGAWVIRFMMPSAFTAETLPRARNDAIRFVEAEPERQIVLTFSGRGTTSALEERTEALREAAGRMGVTITGEPRYYFYDGPFTAPWTRRNEVAFPVS